MLPKEKRLRDERDFKRVYQKGSFFGNSLFSLNALPNRLSITRLGIVISKKVEAKAVRRNKLKRRFREAAGQLYDLLPSGYDVIISIKPSAKDALFEAIIKEVSTSFAKVGHGQENPHRHS